MRHRSMFIPVVLLALGALVSTCKSSDVHPLAPTAPHNNCATTGNGLSERGGPVVCIDPSGSTVAANPPSVVAWDTMKTSPGTPVMVHWIARSGDGLNITMKQDGCVETPSCNNVRHCWAKTLAATDPPKRCHYSMTLSGVTVDPDIVIVKCCSTSVVEEP